MMDAVPVVAAVTYSVIVKAVVTFTPVSSSKGHYRYESCNSDIWHHIAVLGALLADVTAAVAVVTCNTSCSIGIWQALLEIVRSVVVVTAVGVAAVTYDTSGIYRNLEASFAVVAAIVVIAVVTCELCGSMGSSEASFAVLAAIAVVVAAVICSTCAPLEIVRALVVAVVACVTKDIIVVSEASIAVAVAAVVAVAAAVAVEAVVAVVAAVAVLAVEAVVAVVAAVAVVAVVAVTI
ncbi:hypothetical protein ElyMa_002019100 [Elysia marginata]|uniref:Uncharacterized protein n=1 Tax=Elysia marginata TaxID=1093978 RepID=A0AAV4F509_9GAST|nr:hypothetical protein ElyMa_002019100 [Elysia marginata]